MVEKERKQHEREKAARFRQSASCRGTEHDAKRAGRRNNQRVPAVLVALGWFHERRLMSPRRLNKTQMDQHFGVHLQTLQSERTTDLGLRRCLAVPARARRTNTAAVAT